jgi:hypothetical protein
MIERSTSQIRNESGASPLGKPVSNCGSSYLTLSVIVIETVVGRRRHVFVRNVGSHLPEWTVP